MQIINKDLWEQRGICETERVTCWIFNTTSESQFTISLSQAGTSSVKNSAATASFGGCVWDTGNIEKKFWFFSLKLANVEIKCDVLEGRWCRLFVFSFPIQWAESGIFPRCDARPQIFAWTGKLLLLLIVTCIKKKKKKTSATCSGESVMHCHVASSLKLVVPYAPLNSYNI